MQDNTHRLTLTMSPDEHYLDKQARTEEEKLLLKIQALSESDKQDIYQKGEREGEGEPNASLAGTTHQFISLKGINPVAINYI